MFTKKMVKEDLFTVELFAEGGKSNSKCTETDNSKNTGACKNNTNVNVGCA